MGGAAVSSDAAGNLLADGSGVGSHIFTSDGEGRLASLTPYGGTKDAFTYNALGVRAYKTVNSISYQTHPAGNFLASYWPTGWNAGVWLDNRLQTMYGGDTAHTPYFSATAYLTLAGTLIKRPKRCNAQKQPWQID